FGSSPTSVCHARKAAAEKAVLWTPDRPAGGPGCTTLHGTRSPPGAARPMSSRRDRRRTAVPPGGRGTAPATDPWSERHPTMRELLVDFITSLDGYASGEGWPGFWGLEGPEYLG